MTRPGITEYAPYYEKYVSLVPGQDPIGFLTEQLRDTLTMLGGIPEENGGDRYAPGKWSIREVLGHIIDTERVFAYRLLCIARNDKSEFPGFDQDEYVISSRADERTLADLSREFRGVRESTLTLLRTLNEEEYTRTGTASGNTISVRGLIYCIAGHEVHHKQVLRERYLSD